MYSGYYINSYYKEWEVKNDMCWICGETTSTNLTEAIQILHKHIFESKEYIKNNTKFDIYMIDGKIDRFGHPIRIKCYSISMKQAKKYKLI